MLMGAWETHVILTQLFRGLSKGFEGFAKADAIHLAGLTPAPGEQRL